jgi:peptidoglycan/LPS O-acetylase OafA/YrhL
MPESKHKDYRPDIDGLRAIAVLMVVIYHAFPDTLPGGFIGVDIFFIISGYLISLTLFQSIHSNSFKISDFYSRRIRRIFPALSVVLVATGIFGWFALRADEYRQLGKHIAAGAGFASNLVLWSESGYFDSAATTKPLLHLWSLGIEEQFYFFFPIVLWLAWKFRRNMLAVTVSIAAISFCWSIYLYNSNTTALFYSPFSRFWELMLGAMLAYITVYPNKYTHLSSTRLPIDIRALIGAVLLVVGVITASRASAYPGGWGLFPTVGTVLIISAGPSATINKYVLAARPMVWIGLISYPLYLWHWPILSYAHIIEGQIPSASVRLFCVVGAFVLAVMTYWLLEKPLRRLSSQRVVATMLAIIVLSVGVGGAAIHQFKGFEGRAIDLREVKYRGDLDHGDFHSYVKKNFFPCTPDKVLKKAETWHGMKRCFQSKNDRPIDTVLLGDSHAEHLFIGLAESLPKKNVAFYILNGMSVRSNRAFSTIFAAIDSNPNISQIVVSSLWSLRQVPIPDMVKTLKSLQRPDNSIFITDDTPDFDFFPVVCKFKGQCTEPASVFAKRYETYASDLQKAVDSVAGVTLIKTSQYLCDMKLCRMGVDGKLFYRDAHHLNIFGSQFIGAEMVRQNPRLSE